MIEGTNSPDFSSRGLKYPIFEPSDKRPSRSIATEDGDGDGDGDGEGMGTGMEMEMRWPVGVTEIPP